MANVDSRLHDESAVPDALGPSDYESETPKKSLRGAAGGIYIGPVLSRAAKDGEGQTITHATGAAAGGADGSTGYRQANAYFTDGDATGGGMGEGGSIRTSRTGRSFYRGDGVAGGSVAGYPAQRVGQRAAAASGDTGTADSPTGAGAFIDKRSTQAGDGGYALGQAGRGTKVVGTTVTQKIGRPTLQGDETGLTGTVDVVEVVDGGSAIDADVDATTVTKYPSGLLEVFVYERGTDTDEDGGLVGKGDWTLSATQSEAFGAVAGPKALTAGTYAVYVRFVDSNGAVGPMSNRFALTIA